MKTVLVATDDERISEAISRVGGDVVMTSVECKTGTDRVIEALEKISGDIKYDAVVNIQVVNF